MKKITLSIVLLIVTTFVLSPAMFALELTSSEMFALELTSSDDYYKQLDGEGVTINVYNWGEYISDGSDDMLDVNSEFEDLTGISVHYTTFASNEEMYAKLKSGGAQYDIVIPSDYMIARMIREEMVEPLNFENIPTYSHVSDLYKDLIHDPDNMYSVPYMWGVTGLIYNTSMIESEITAWADLWDQNYIGNILMFSNSRDAFGIALKMLGYSMNTEDPEELEEAAEVLKEQKMLVQAYVMDEIFNKMEGGEAAIAPYYAGDAITMIDSNPDLAFVFPEEGSNFFVDSFVIPKGSNNKLAAEMYINFMTEPRVSAENATYIGYSTTVPDALDYMELDEQTMAIAYPPDEVIEKTEIFQALSEEAGLLVDAHWTEILSYNENENVWIGPVFLFGALAASIIISILRARKRKKEIF